LLIVACCSSKRAGCGWSGIDQLGQPGLEYAGLNVGEQHGVVQPGVGDAVAVRAGDAVDQPVAAQPAWS